MNPQPYAPGKPGIFRMEATDYHAAPGIGKHSLDLLHDFPEKLQIFRKHGMDATDAMEFSTLLHTAVIEPDKLEGSYYIRPDKFKPGEKQAWDSTHTDKPSLKRDELATLNNITRQCRNHPIVGALLEEGEAELSLFAHCPITGLLRKGRTDWITTDADDRLTVVDFKFVADASKHGFRRQVEDLRYYVQHPYYVDLLELLGYPGARFLFVAVEKEPVHPKAEKHCIKVYELHNLEVEMGRNNYIRDLIRYKDCHDLDEWPDDSEKIETLILSSWCRKENAV